MGLRGSTLLARTFRLVLRGDASGRAAWFTGFQGDKALSLDRPGPAAVRSAVGR